MDEYIKRLKEKKFDESFDKTSEWLIESQNKLQNRKNKRRTIKMKQYLIRHKLQFAIVILFALLIAACNYPISQNETMGYVLSWTVPGSENSLAAESLNKLNWYKSQDISATVKNINGTEITEYKLLVQSADDKTVISYKDDLENIKQLTSIKIVPLNQNIKRPVYSAALNTFFKVDISSSKMSDEQVQAELKRQLTEAGFNDINVSYKNDETGRKKLEIKFPENTNAGENKTLDVNVEDNNGKQVVKMRTGKPDVDFSKMTDEEIRKYIKEKNKEDNLSDDEIKITRKEGNVSVNVNIEKVK